MAPFIETSHGGPKYGTPNFRKSSHMDWQTLQMHALLLSITASFPSNCLKPGTLDPAVEAGKLEHH